MSGSWLKKWSLHPSAAVTQQQVASGKVRNTDVQLLQGRSSFQLVAGEREPCVLGFSGLERSLCFAKLGGGRKGSVQVETPQFP